MVDKRSIEEKKVALLEALGESFGVIGVAAKAARLSRSTFYRYYDEDPKFKEAADEILELQADVVENKLLQHIEEGDKDCIRFYLKYKGAKLGYMQNVKQEVNHKGIKIVYVTPEEDTDDED